MLRTAGAEPGGTLSLGALDQSPIPAGGTAAQALRDTVALAQAAERLGYRHFWVAEHHNTEMFAGTAPEILIGQIAANTRSIRVGSGGVMLSHYSAFKVAETFRLLAALYPGRIDLGIGRAPGSDQMTAVALSYPRPLVDVRQFPEQVADLLGYLSNRLPPEHPFARVVAQPGPPPSPESVPEVWLLGSSDYSAQLAAALGLPFAFADFFGYAGEDGPAVAELYRRQFQPSEYLAEPRLNVAVNVFCAESEEQARRISASMRLVILLRRTGRWRQVLLPAEEALRQLDAPDARELAKRFTRHYIQGTPEQARAGLLAAAERYGTPELTVVTNCFALEDRIRSYELVAETLALPNHSTRTLR